MADRHEMKRLELLHGLQLLDTPPEAAFDAIAEATKCLFGCKIALVSLIDSDRQWFKARCGLAATQTTRDVAFCAHAVAADDLLIVPDATLDPRFADNPLVRGAPFVRLYAGMPVRARAAPGEPALPLGTLCAIDDRPGEPTPAQIATLRRMAALVEALFELRLGSRYGLASALERHDALVRIDRKQRQLAQAERMADLGSWRLDLATDHVEWSDQTYAIHGLAPGDGDGAARSRALQYYPAKDRAQLEAALQHCIDGGAPFDLELDFINARRQPRRVRVMGEPELADGVRIGVIGVFHDVTERYRMEQILRESAQTDELTGLASRRAFNQHMDAAIGSARRDGTPLAVILLDLDRFKEVNDRLGHAAGDDVLRIIADRIRRAPYLKGCFAARLGGDEFVLALHGADAAERLGEVARRLLFDLRCRVGPKDSPILVSTTIGASMLTDAHDTRSALLHAADVELYRAKRLSRGTAALAGHPDVLTGRAMPARASHAA